MSEILEDLGEILGEIKEIFADVLNWAACGVIAVAVVLVLL
jgi:hypothetical protein